MSTRAVNIAAAVAVLLLMVGAGLAGLRMGRQTAAAERERADSLATDLAAAAIRERGYEAAVATMEDVGAYLREEADSLAGELEALRVQLVARAGLTATAEGEAEAPAETHVASADSAAGPDSVTARIQDGLIDARLTYLVDPALFRLRYRLEVPIKLYGALGPDRRLMAFARSPDPRVRLQFDTLAFDPPAPIAREPPWLCAGVAVGSGALAALLKSWWAAGAGAGAIVLACQ